MLKKRQRSLHWEERKHITHRFGSSGFPYDEGWPHTYVGQLYTIILMNGERHDAVIDDSRQYMSEGLEWRTRKGNVGRQLVVAWREQIEFSENWRDNPHSILSSCREGFPTYHWDHEYLLVLKDKKIVKATIVGERKALSWKTEHEMILQEKDVLAWKEREEDE